MSKWPDDVQLDISSIEFKTPDWSLYSDKKSKVKVSENQDAAVSLFDSTVRLWNIESEKFIDMEIVKPKNKLNKPYIVMAPHAWIVPSNNYKSYSSVGC